MREFWLGGFNWSLQRFPDVGGRCGGGAECPASLRGRPETPRVVRERFWDLVRSGLSPREAGGAVGARRGAERWFAAAGGVKALGPGPVSGRYLSVADREEIAVG